KPDRDAAVPPAMPDQRDKQDLRRQPVEVAHAVEPEPGLAAGPVIPPANAVVPLLRPVALAGDEAVAPAARRLQLRAEDVDRGLGEILDAAGVIEVQMGENDVADI